MKETVSLGILIDNLFNEVIDQTLFDYRNTEYGDRYAMSKNDRDIFDVNIRSVIDNIHSSSLGAISQVQYEAKKIILDIQRPDSISDTIIASRCKDCIKYAMLARWNSTRNQQLYIIYQQRYEECWSNLKVSLNCCSERPYSIY